MMVGAIKAKVEELTDPTNEINRSSLGTAAAKATKTMNERNSCENPSINK